MTSPDLRTCAWFTSHVSRPLATMTGIGRYVVELVTALAANGASPGWKYAISGPRAGLRPDWLPPAVDYRPTAIPRQALRMAWSVAQRPSLDRLIGEFDLVHALHASSPVPSKRPGVTTVHDLMPIDHPEWYGPGVSWSASRAMRALAQGQGPVIAVSQYVADQVEAHGVGRERLIVIHHGVRDRFRRRVPAEEQIRVVQRYGVIPGRYFLAIGNIGTRKNLTTLIKAMHQAGLVKYHLVLAGPPHTGYAEVQAELERTGLQSQVRQPGFVPDEDLPALIQGARGLLHPAVDEGFGLPPLEAMAGGTPVAGADAGSLPEVIGSAGLLIPPLDVQAWAEAITAIAGDDDLHRRLAQSGPERAQAFTWEEAARQTLDVYRMAST